MTNVSNNVIKITLFVILCKFYLVHGEVTCFYPQETDKSTCNFINIKTNETSPYFGPKTPKDPLNINTIDVRSSLMPLLTDEFCKAFPNLKRLDIMGSVVNRIQQDALSFCKDLTHFIIFKNELTEVSRDLFINKTELIEISFQYNNLTFLHVELFEPTQKLVRLILSNNLLIHFNFREMPLLQTLTELYIDGNNLLDLDEFGVVQQFPNLRNFAFNENLLDCRNLKLVVDVMKEKNITLIEFIHRKRISTFVTREEEGRQCLDRKEHLRAMAYYLDDVPGGRTPTYAKEEQKLHVIIVQFITATLILLCVLMNVWHGFYWRKDLNSMSEMANDKGDYYYGSNLNVHNVGGRGNEEKTHNR